jgi:hypothetical protein
MTSVASVTGAPNPRPTSTARKQVGRTHRLTALALVGLAAVALGACGGDDDDTADTTVPQSTVGLAVSTTTLPAAPLVTNPPTTPPPTTPVLVTQGATVVVANASRVDGAAGRLSERLTDAGFTLGEPTDSAEGPLETTKVYYNASVPEAQPVAQSVVAALGGGAITLEPLPTPAPTESGDIGDATVLVAMGNDTADKTLEELQGIEAPATTAATEGTTADTAEDTTASTGG